MNHLMLIAAIACFVTGATLSADDAGRVLVDFEEGFRIADVETRDVSAGIAPAEGGGRALLIRSGHNIEWPGITLKAPDGKWDLSDCAWVSMDVRNVGDNEARVSLRVDNPGANGRDNCVQVGFGLEPGEARTLTAPLSAGRIRFSEPVELVGMRGVPGGTSNLDPANVIQLIVFVPRPSEDQAFQIDNIRAGGAVETWDSDDFFPFIDRFGQYMHDDWPGKTHSEEDMAEAARAEAADLDAYPGPDGWNQYGGWTDGPQLEATGHFRTQKLDGKWWLVDPEGRLFWSHGIDCVGTGGATTPITDREQYFAALPAEGDPLAAFYGTGRWAPRGYYQGKGEYRTFNFTAANAFRKYGESYEEAVADMAHRRLRSWGMNSIGNWSSSDIYMQRRTPYTVNVWFQAPNIEGSEGFWRKFPDPFDERFAQNLRSAMERWQSETADDPWCIGYFVHNELSWGDDVGLAVAALQSPGEQPAKLAFVADLRAKYGNVATLNAAWGTTHASWDALLADRTAPDRARAEADLKAFYAKLAGTYFRTIREELKRAAPDILYLGCRFAWVNDTAARAAGEHCDVVCYNQYKHSVADFRMPAGVDAPVIVGEFHFGALDRGMFHTGLQPTKDQNERAAMYESYVRGALGNPQIVGTHWFQYGSQATTGRGDGENYQIGFLDLCDTPYSETIAACREVGYGLYATRAGR